MVGKERVLVGERGEGRDLVGMGEGMVQYVFFKSTNQYCIP